MGLHLVGSHLLGMKSFFVVAALASMASAANLFEKAQMRNGAQIMNGFANIVSKINKDLLMQYKEEIEQHLDSNEKKYMCYGSDKWKNAAVTAIRTTTPISARASSTTKATTAPADPTASRTPNGNRSNISARSPVTWRD